MFLFFVNFLYNSYLFVRFKRFLQPIQMTPEEFRMFGIDEKECGFKLKDMAALNDSCQELKNKPKISLTPKFEISFENHSNHGNSSLDSTALSSRFNDSNSQYDIKPTGSWSFNLGTVVDSPYSKRSDASLNNSLSQKQIDGIRFRRSRSFLNDSFNKSLSPTCSSSVITSKADLDRYLQEHEQRQEELEELFHAEKRYGNVNPILQTMTDMNSASPTTLSPGQNTNHSATRQQFLQTTNNDLFIHNNSMTPTKHVSFVGNSFNDSSRFLAHQSPPRTLTPPSYKSAIKIHSPPSGSSLEKSESLNSSTRTLEKILTKLNVDDSRLNQMVENIRKWISQTILVRLCREIESINKLIVEKGYIDSMIGETPLKNLKQLAESRRTEFPTLEQVCPFLDISNVRNLENTIPLQEYLVRRLKDLAKGGCMIEFLWDGGGSYNYRPWKQDSMLTDAELILHVFCTYMDSRLLFNPALPEGKPFTSQHFKVATLGGSPGTNSSSMKFIKSDTYIKQDKIYPPHYSLVLKGEHFEIPPGRNNLFYALLIFIHHIKVKNFGLLGRINLGPSGLNIAWVIESK
uniref:Transmembrane protein 209-like n=1 Tax=Dermatophagoides pteronyssinus TaxID=6956 RepID=A0A6P6XX23_DERPT|nr:transmembrane protein 209-like [Dermatophagoides pteronyssinus]